MMPWVKVVRDINTKGYHGVTLEPIEEKTPGYAMGVAIIPKNRHETFFMKERPEFTDDQYFELFKKLVKEKNITFPDFVD